MKSEWFTPKEITKMAGMPATIQGVHKKAKREGWPSRRKQGIQGPAVEFCMEATSENIPNYQAFLPSPSEQELLTVWLAVFNQLTDKDRSLLIATIIKYGVCRLIQYEQPTQAEKLAALIETLPVAEQELVLKWIKAKQLKHFTAAKLPTPDPDDR